MGRNDVIGYRESGHKTIAEWIVEHGLERDQHEYLEGPRCQAIADAMAVAVTRVKIVTAINGRAARQWPPDVLEAWGRDYLKRRGEIKTLFN